MAWTTVFQFPAEAGTFLFATTTRPSLRNTQPCIQRVMNIRDSVAKGEQPECEADHLPPSSDKVNNMWGHTSTLPYICTA